MIGGRYICAVAAVVQKNDHISLSIPVKMSIVLITATIWRGM